MASRKNAHSQNQVMAAKNKAASANKAGSVNGVPLKKRNGRTEEYEGDFLLDMDFAGLISVVLTKSQTVIIFGIIGKPAELFAKPAIAYTTAG